MWDLGPGSEGRLSPQAQTLPGGHSDYVLSVCFSQDGKYIISGSKDRSVTIWDAKLMKRVSNASSSSSSNGVLGVVVEVAVGAVRLLHAPGWPVCRVAVMCKADLTGMKSSAATP